MSSLIDAMPHVAEKSPAAAQRPLSPFRKEKTRMYAIAFDMDTESLKRLYENDSWNNAYADIKAVLRKYGFD